MARCLATVRVAAAGLLGELLAGSVLVVLDEAQGQVGLSFRNLPRVSVMPASNVGVSDVIRAASLVCSQEALDALTARATGQTRDLATAGDEG